MARLEPCASRRVRRGAAADLGAGRDGAWVSHIFVWGVQQSSPSAVGALILKLTKGHTRGIIFGALSQAARLTLTFRSTL